MPTTIVGGDAYCPDYKSPTTFVLPDEVASCDVCLARSACPNPDKPTEAARYPASIPKLRQAASSVSTIQS